MNRSALPILTRAGVGTLAGRSDIRVAERGSVSRLLLLRRNARNPLGRCGGQALWDLRKFRTS